MSTKDLSSYRVPYIISYIHKSYGILLEKFSSSDSKYYDIYLKYIELTSTRLQNFGNSLFEISSYINSNTNSKDILDYKKDLIFFIEDLEKIKENL